MRYITDVDRWLSHENRMARAGEEFDTDFPLAPDGKPMRLGENMREVKSEAKQEVKSDKQSKG